MTPTATGWRSSRNPIDHGEYKIGHVTLLVVVTCPAMHQSVCILGGNQSDFARNLAKEDPDFAAITSDVVGTVQG
jgi:hypothetical protein